MGHCRILGWLEVHNPFVQSPFFGRIAWSPSPVHSSTFRVRVIVQCYQHPLCLCGAWCLGFKPHLSLPLLFTYYKKNHYIWLWCSSKLLPWLQGKKNGWKHFLALYSFINSDWLIIHQVCSNLGLLSCR